METLNGWPVTELWLPGDLDKWLVSKGLRPEDVPAMRPVLVETVLSMVAGAGAWNSVEFQRNLVCRGKEMAEAYADGSKLGRLIVNGDGTGWAYEE
jgi:hypothetical protein